MSAPRSEQVEADGRCWVYLLRCADGTLYCGWSTDVARRVREHQSGRASRYTRSRRPVTLAARWVVIDRSAALREEARVKRLPREQKLALIANVRAVLLGGTIYVQ